MTTQPDANAAEVFVSYSREDIERALDIARHLEAAGVNLWIDKRGIQGSQNWRAKITRAIKACQILAVLCSESSMRSRYVRREIAIADDLERSLLPIHLENTEYPDEVYFCLVESNFIEALDQPIEDWLPEFLDALDAKGIHCDASYRPPPLAVQALAVPSEEALEGGVVEEPPADTAPATMPKVYRPERRVERAFRIFVDSTFSDLVEERDALQRRVFPQLRELCMSHGCRFEAVDMRWGMSEEASLDQQTMNLVLSEIERCQAITPRPNYIALLGDHYGWRPPPPLIPADEFELILARVSDDGDRELLLLWYPRDENAVPPQHWLRPREKGGAYEDNGDWSPIERRLRSILMDAVDGTKLEDDPKYVASATEQGVIRGALSVPDASEDVFCFFRTIRGLPEDRRALGFRDLDEDGRPDVEAAGRLEHLKQQLRERLQGNVYEYEADWTRDGPTSDHVEQLCEDVYGCLSRVIREEIDRRGVVDQLDEEVASHQSFGADRSRNFIGRELSLERIAEYVDKADPHPLAIYGRFGSGQSPLIARAARIARERHPHAAIMLRFIGATPQSAEARTLLTSLCQEISRLYGAHESGVPTGYGELVEDFPKRLSLASAEHPLIIFLDALDQLSDANGGRSLVWLPSELPWNVRIVVSTIGRPEAGEGLPANDPLVALSTKLPDSNLVELRPMSIEEGGALLDAWLAEAGATVTDAQRAELLANFEAEGLPLYLKLAFEEARRWRSYTPAEETALSSGIRGIIRDNRLKRLSAEENYGELLVSRTLGYLAAAKNGLSEDELLDVLSRDSQVMDDFRRRFAKSPPVDRLPRKVWSELHFDLEPFLSLRAADGAELMTFSHRQIREVVEEDYLAGDEGRERHRQLAVYFADQPLEWRANGDVSVNLRSLSELPYQQTYGELWDDLVLTLTDFDFLERKAAHAGVMEAVDSEGRVTRAYTGVYELQDDFARALERMPGGGDANGARRRVFVTGTDLGAGLELQCPHCKRSSDFLEEWRGQDIACPSCGGPLRVNEAVVERHSSASATGRPK